MAAALLAKFTQRAECRRPLLASGAALLAEYSEKDPYWGRGRRSGGANYLGRLLMAVRDLLRQQPATQGSVRGTPTGAAGSLRGLRLVWLVWFCKYLAQVFGCGMAWHCRYYNIFF